MPRSEEGNVGSQPACTSLVTEHSRLKILSGELLREVPKTQKHATGESASTFCLAYSAPAPAHKSSSPIGPHLSSFLSFHTHPPTSRCQWGMKVRNMVSKLGEEGQKYNTETCRYPLHSDTPYSVPFTTFSLLSA